MGNPVPKHLRERFGSSHAFRSAKREQIRRLDHELKHLRDGCAFLPADGYRRVQKISDHLDDLRQMCSVKEWGK